jgi:hypothetical protein
MEVFNDPCQKLYTLKAAADCNGFVEEACMTVLRPETLTAETKMHYIRNYLLPVLYFLLLFSSSIKKNGGGGGISFLLLLDKINNTFFSAHNMHDFP